MKYNLIKVLKVVVVLLLVIFFFAYSGASSQRDIAEQRLDNCRDLALELDALYSQATEDIFTLGSTWDDSLNYQISDSKAATQIKNVTTRLKKREFQYQRVVDLYNFNCFGIQ